MVPEVAGRAAVMVLNRVVFPAPLGPIMEVMRWRGIWREASLTATTPPNRLVTPSRVRRGG